MRRAWLVVLVFAGTAGAKPGAASLRPKRAEPAHFEDPCIDGNEAVCRRHALDAFRDALAVQRAKQRDHPLRISYFGDSLTGDDQITGALRSRLQMMVGDGGPGFVFAASPHPFNRHRAVARTMTGTWSLGSISALVPPDHLLGLGGSAESEGRATIKLSPTGPIRTVDVHYLAQPRGGRLDIIANGKKLASITTAAKTNHSAFETAIIPDGATELELRAHGRVRLFGVSLEAASGAVVDNLGIVSATVKQMHNNNLDEHMRKQLAHRASDLVVVMYGANEAEWLRAGTLGVAEHEKLLGGLLARIRTANPNASCLVVSPLDQLDAHDARRRPRDSVPAIVAAQRRAAKANGCAFWNAYAWMGGKGSSAKWQNRGYLERDFQHPTIEGAERIADALYGGLVEIKAAARGRRFTRSGNVPSGSWNARPGAQRTTRR